MPAAQRGVAFASTHALAQLPHREGSVLRFTSQPSAAMLLQSAKPLLQVNPQIAPSQLEVALAYVGHAVHEPPHVATELLLTQLPPQL